MTDLSKCWAEAQSWQPGDVQVQWAAIYGRCEILRPPAHDGERARGEKVADGLIVSVGDTLFGLYYDKATRTFRTAPLHGG